MGKRLKAAWPVFLIVLAWNSPAFGADPFTDFTFRRVKPPEAGAKKLITIQVGPATPTAELPTTTEPVAQPDDPNGFWSRISPELAAAAPGRFQMALDALATNPAAPGLQGGPNLAALHRLAGLYGTDILIASLGTRISPALVLAMIGVHQHTPQGLMGLAPGLADQPAVTGPQTARDLIKAGVVHLDQLLSRFSGDPILALAAYQAGEAAVIAANGVPALEQTRTYVPKVVAAFQIARALCRTPPELFSDGCVFAIKEQD